MSRYDEVQVHAENTFSDDDPRWLDAATRRAIWTEYRNLIGALYDSGGGWGSYDAVSVFFCDGTGIMGGLPASEDECIEVCLGHHVIAVDVATDRIWDMGPGGGLFCYDRQRRCWYPSVGGEWKAHKPGGHLGFIARVCPVELRLTQDDDKVFVDWSAYGVEQLP